MALITIPNSFSAGATIVASEHNDNFSTIADDYNGNITNANVAAGAAIVGSKLNLAAPGNIGATTPGTGKFTTLNATGATTLDGATTIGNASGDALTYHPAAWTLTNSVSITGTWTDLGTVTTVDINGGTLDGVQIGGTTATGELIVNDSADAANGLGDQGTSGQILESAGAGSNPTWVAGPGTSLLSTTTMTGSSNSGNIAIAAAKVYFVTFEFNDADDTGGAVMAIRFNSDGNSIYNWVHDTISHGTSPASSLVGDNSDTEIEMGPAFKDEATADSTFRGQFFINTTLEGALSATVKGSGVIQDDTGGVYNGVDFSGVALGTLTIADFEILPLAGNVDGVIKVYEFA